MIGQNKGNILNLSGVTLNVFYIVLSRIRDSYQSTVTWGPR